MNTFCLCSSPGDEIEDERTGIAEGGWRKEKADAKTQLNKDMEDESGESASDCVCMCNVDKRYH